MRVIPLLSLVFKIKNMLECFTNKDFNIEFLMVPQIRNNGNSEGGERVEDLSALSYFNLIFSLLKLFSEIIVKPVFIFFFKKKK